MFSDKPQGLWVSVDGDNDWKSWCTSTGYKKRRLAIRYRVTLKKPRRLLWLGTVRKIRNFQKKYGAVSLIFADAEHLGVRAIDWDRVSKDYAGIVIAPYQWSLRHDFMWYYIWDCASGCIWDTSVIESVKRLRGKSKLRKS